MMKSVLKNKRTVSDKRFDIILQYQKRVNDLYILFKMIISIFFFVSDSTASKYSARSSLSLQELVEPWMAPALADPASSAENPLESIFPTSTSQQAVKSTEILELDLQRSRSQALVIVLFQNNISEKKKNIGCYFSKSKIKVIHSLIILRNNIKMLPSSDRSLIMSSFMLRFCQQILSEGSKSLLQLFNAIHTIISFSGLRIGKNSAEII